MDRAKKVLNCGYRNTDSCLTWGIDFLITCKDNNMSNRLLREITNCQLLEILKILRKHLF